METSPFDELLNLFERRGPAHLGEDVSQLDHALQCADLAVRDGAEAPMVAAALLHDIGHLVQLDRAGGRRLEIESELVHDRIGADYLAQWFGPEVVTPVALHVQAKRYLCGVELGYRTTLSDEARRRLDLQGGAMQREEAVEFLARPGAADAVRLRRWDDAAKVDGLEPPPLRAHRELLDMLVVRPEH